MVTHVEKEQGVLEEGREEDYTQDGTVDLKGRAVLRSQTGRWRACSFIVGNYQYTLLPIFASVDKSEGIIVN